MMGFMESHGTKFRNQAMTLYFRRPRVIMMVTGPHGEGDYFRAHPIQIAVDPRFKSTPDSIRLSFNE